MGSFSVEMLTFLSQASLCVPLALLPLVVKIESLFAACSFKNL